VIRSLLDSKLVVRVNEHWRAARDIRSIEVPDTLVGVITARLDRLEDSTRLILQSAAVLGREFSMEILEEIVDAPDILEDCLVELQRRELLREKSRHPQRTYAFKHVLTQEAAYNTILLSRRRELHRRSADALIVQSPDAAAEIARHLLEARQPARAVPYLVQAGESAARAYASGEAIAFFHQALEYKDVAGDISYIWRAYTGLGDALTLTNRIEEAQQVFHTMREEAENFGDAPARIKALNKLAGNTAMHLGQFQLAEQFLSQAEHLSRSSNELSGIPDTNLIRCQMCTAQADFENVVLYMDEVVSIGRQLGNPSYIALGMEHAASSLVYMLEFDEARKRAEEGLKLAREIGDKLNEAFLLCLPIPVLYLQSGDYQSAEDALHLAQEISVKIGVLPAQALAAYLLADIARWRGDYEQALHHGQRSLEAGLLLEQYMPFFLVPILGCLGSIYQEISPKLTDKIAEFHQHALRLLESPTAAMTSGTAWSDLGHCAIELGDLEVAEQALNQGIHSPNMFTRLERPRHLAGLALLASIRGEHAEALRLANEACGYAEEHQLGYHAPFTALVQGKVLLAGALSGAHGELEAGLASLAQAVELAGQCQIRPVIWKAHVAAAQALAAAGQPVLAEQHRAEAQAMVAEIAGLFENQDLRQQFLSSALQQIR
jgi:tetratricopeptide (TPR) repeat protein